MEKIIPPTNCPECDSSLIWKNDTLYCVNYDCKAKNSKSLEHWAKTMKIKGLGPQTIQKLQLYSVEDLYALSEEEIVSALGSEKLSSKLYLEIEKSRKAPLNMCLPAFGIPLIGNSAAQKLCSIISHLDELTTEKAVEAGLGPKAVTNLMDWYYKKYIPEYQGTLNLNFKSEKHSVKEVKEVKGTVCITGKLSSVKTKSEAEKLLLDNGYLVKGSLTKDVTILVNESGIESAKTEKARNTGVKIITNLNQLIGVKHG